MAKEIQITNTIYKCEKCDKMSYSEEVAENCCKPKYCNKCNCELPHNHYFLICDICREKEWFDKASKTIPQEYTEDMVYFKDKYYYSVEDCLDEISEEEFNTVKYVQGCDKDRYELNYDSIIVDFEENSDIEDFEVDKQGIKELKNFLEQWNKKYGTDRYYPNNVAILIDDDFKKGLK